MKRMHVVMAEEREEAPMVEITLSWGEVEHAGIIGCLRRVSALRNNRPEPWGVPPGERWRNDIESSAAEMAAAKATNQYWHAFYDDPKKAPGDIGHNNVPPLQRATRILPPISDPPRRVVVGAARTAT